jgi:murein L,D-transpeptidase YcbB/YkuD
LAVASTAYDAYQMGSALEDTQDPVEQLRFVYTQQSEQPLKIGRGGLSRSSMETMAAENPEAVMSAVEEGILDPSVLGSLGLLSPLPAAAAATKTSASAPARGRTVFEDIDIQAGGPKASAAAARPARGGSTGNLMMGSRGEGVAEVQKKLSTLGTMTPGVSFDLGSTGADGVFGGKTKRAVEAFQRMAGIEVDGIVGSETQAALDKAMGAAVGAKEAEMAAKANVDAPQFGAGLKRVDEGPLDAAANEFEDMAVIEPVKSDRDAPTQNTQAYEDLELDEKVRPSPFPMFRSRRNRR